MSRKNDMSHCKMVHFIFYCSLRHYSQPCSKERVCIGGKDGSFSLCTQRPQSSVHPSTPLAWLSPPLCVRSTQNQLPLCSLVSARRAFLSTISPQETQQQSNPVPPRGQRQATRTQNTTWGLWPARRVPTRAERAGDTWSQPPAECPQLALTLMPQTAREANKSSPMSAFYIKLTFIYLLCI